MTRWCDHLEPVTEVVDCSGGRHRVTWRRGKVVVEDHDLVAERAMRVLGAETPACLRILKQWRDLHRWATSTELFVQMRSRLGPERILAPGALGVPHELSLLLTWERAWRMSSYYGAGHERLLHEQLRDRAMDPVRRHVEVWAHRLGSAAPPSVDIEIIRPLQAPRLTGTIDALTARVTARLGVAWVLQVWARGLALVEDALVLELLPSPTALGARAVRWEADADGSARPVAALARLERGAEGRWQLAREAKR